MNTKKRILKQSRLLFNKNGFYNITIAEIASACAMSRGNLTYHYKTKDAILADIGTEISQEISQFQEERKNYPAFSNLNLDIKICRQLQATYPFVFRDMNVLDNEHINKVMKSWSESSILQNQAAFSFGLEIGNLKEESMNGLYYQLAVNTWLVTFYWISQSSVREIQELESVERMVWTIIYPHFTEKGREAFHGYFGADYFQGKEKFNISQSVNTNVF